VTATRKPGKLLDWKAILGIILSLALLYWALRNEDFGQVVEEIRGADPFWFTASIFSATIVFWLRAWRWGPLLATAFPNASFQSRFRATTIGFMGNNLLPARIGEFARAYALARQERGSMVAAFASLLAERLFDAMAVVGFLFLAMLMPDFPEVMGRQFSTMANGMAIAIVLLIALCFSLVLFPVQTVRFFEDRIAPRLPAKVRRPLVDALEAFLLGLSSLRSPGLLGRVSFQTVVLWIVNASGFYFAFKAFGIDVPFSGALFLQSIVALAVSAPSTPGFFGPFEAATKLVLVELYGVDSTRAVGFAIGFHLGGFIPVTLMGLYYAWRLGLSWREVEYSEETVEEAVERELPGAQVQEEQRKT
jgi:uncharacterized protein (TIRG00374 family)